MENKVVVVLGAVAGCEVVAAEVLVMVVYTLTAVDGGLPEGAAVGGRTAAGGG